MNHIFKSFTSALLGAVAIIGCQREPVVVNPNFNPETDEVNAAFVMSVATGSSSATKMSAANVQQSNNFLGIDNAKLFLYTAPQTAPVTPFVYPGEGCTFKQVYDLGNVLTAGAITAANNASSSSNRILQLTLPINADAALFYGKAVNTSPGKVQGKMDFSHIDQNPANTYFGVERRIGDESKVSNYDATGRLMIFAINTIIATSLGTDESYTVKTVEYTNLPEISWKELGHKYEIKHNSNPYGRDEYSAGDIHLSTLEETMGKAYATFTHISRAISDPNDNTITEQNPKILEYRAGSSAAVKSMMKSLYDVLSKTAGATPLNKEDANVVRLANKAIDNLNMFFTDSWSYKNVSVIKSAVIQAGLKTDEAWNSSFSGATDLNGYPYTTFGIPEGAAQLAFNPTDDTFYYTNPNKALVTPNRTFDPRKYVYPPELAYYVNSPLYVTAKSDLSVSDYPNGTTPWNTRSGETSKWVAGGWTIGKVSSNTRGVAIRDNINYGVALLETKVGFTAAAISVGLDDNQHNMTGDTDRTIPVEDAHFELRGILIGGVHPRYNWQFIPRALTEAEQEATIASTGNNQYGVFDGVIYDDAIPASAIPTSGTSEPNYTLVYDNYDYTKDDDVTQNDVYIALEFVNNGDAFWGRENLIPAGGVFYLGAKLSAAPKKLEEGHTNEDQTISWPTDHQIPPIYETGDNRGESKQIPRVFIQDFLTKATFKIGRESLKQAYYAIPDLASSQMSFGLSVDLSWESGYEYEIEFGAIE